MTLINYCRNSLAIPFSLSLSPSSLLKVDNTAAQETRITIYASEPPSQELPRGLLLEVIQGAFRCSKSVEKQVDTQKMADSNRENFRCQKMLSLCLLWISRETHSFWEFTVVHIHTLMLLLILAKFKVSLNLVPFFIITLILIRECQIAKMSTF